MGAGYRGAEGVTLDVTGYDVFPLLEGRGWGWVGYRKLQRPWHKLADPPPAPPFQGGGI
ncbi:hypothetical protein QFZ54_003419 [Sphingomonas faeni]|nr:hypothetical protein [Sphingomonas faeni]